jgi:hypothetical protein
MAFVRAVFAPAHAPFLAHFHLRGGSVPTSGNGVTFTVPAKPPGCLLMTPQQTSPVEAHCDAAIRCSERREQVLLVARV